MTNNLAGGWSNWSDLNKEAKLVFDTALKNFTGVGYTPLVFATQVVKGKNYCYVCKGIIVNSELPMIMAQIYIYQPLTGDPVIVEIKKITP